MISTDKYTYIYISDHAQLVVGAIPPLAELESQLPPAEVEEVATFASEKRKRERLAWRAMLREVLEISPSVERVVEYDKVGAPHLINSPLHISVSHSSTHVALLISQNRCAVDIEPANRNCAKVKSRFISRDEEQIISSDLDLCRAWCTKEAIYKYAGAEGLSLLDDIRIKESHANYFVATFRGFQASLHVDSLLVEGLVVAYVA